MCSLKETFYISYVPIKYDHGGLVWVSGSRLWTSRGGLSFRAKEWEGPSP